MEELKKVLFNADQDSQELKCATCTKYLSVPPILHSSTLGYICGRCHKKVSERETSKDIVLERQVLFEICAKHLVFPCSYKIIGCQAELKWDEVLNHENACTFKNTICPLSDKNKKFLSLQQTCSWRGHSQQLIQHLSSAHRDSFINPPQTYLGPDFKTICVFTEVLQQVMMIVFKYNKDLDKFAIYVLANLSEVECNFFRYQVETYDEKRTTSVVLRRNKIEPMCDHIFKNKATEGALEMDVKHMKEMLKNTTSFFVKVGIVKKTKKEIKVLKSNLPPDSVLNVPPKEHTLTIDEGILQELECPVCNDYMTPPIFICQAGHSVCDSCNKKIVTCPTCRSNMLSTRNFTLEKLTALVNYPCKNRSTGCFFVTSAEKIRKHEKICDLSGKNCILKCSWKGNTMDMIIHLTEKHDILQLDEFNTLYLSPQKQTVQQAVIYDNQVFLFIYSFGFKHPFIHILQHLGSDDSKYKYEMYIHNISDSELILRRQCFPWKDDSEKKNDSKDRLRDGVVMPYELIQPILFDNRNFEFKINISKVTAS